ncbi:hypothetical protein [Vibrio furnissii]|uniref:hypothetical protein n=1 Tax=Vibrio furnissii TaxID=29494 RepID=UPI0023DCC743|nr:hypothetical protein [Vibrio furnissii]
MDSTVYTLIGALGGVLITQVANYFLESKKSENQKDLKSLELQKSRDHDLYKERRVAYAKFLEAVDKSAASMPKDLNLCIGQLYAAIIVASDDTAEKIKEVFNLLKQGELVTEDFLEAKKKLLKAMQSDLQN